MKKIYIQPQTDVCEIQVSTQILAGSPGVIGGNAGEGVGYGGIDDSGEKDPDVKGNSWGDIWD